MRAPVTLRPTASVRRDGAPTTTPSTGKRRPRAAERHRHRQVERPQQTSRSPPDLAEPGAHPPVVVTTKPGAIVTFCRARAIATGQTGDWAAVGTAVPSLPGERGSSSLPR